MAFQAFNFGKQLGIVGGGTPSKESPVSGDIQIEVVDTEIWTGGGYWRPGGGIITYGSPFGNDNPLNPTTWLLPTVEWNDGPDPRSNPAVLIGGRGRYLLREDPPTDPDEPPNNGRSIRIKWSSLPGRVEETACSHYWKVHISGLYAAILESRCLDGFPRELNLRRDMEDYLFNEKIEIICESDPEKCKGTTPSHGVENPVEITPISDTHHYVYDQDLNRIRQRERPLIRLCPGFFNQSLEEQWNTLLHELIHALGGTEIDCRIIEFICQVGSSPDLPFPKFDPNDAFSLYLWCMIAWAQDRGFENPTEVVSTDVIPHLFLKGKYFYIDIDSGDIYARTSPLMSYALPRIGNIKEFLPPREWFEKGKKSSGCK